jgi:hypothetical protein
MEEKKTSSGLTQRQGHDVNLHEDPGGLGRAAKGGVGLPGDMVEKQKIYSIY